MRLNRWLGVLILLLSGGCNTVGMRKSQASGSVHPHIRIGDRSECFGQTGTGSTRKNMPANVTVTNMNNAHSIFRTPVLHQPQMFEPLA